MDLIAHFNPTSSTQWVFLSLILILFYIAFLKFNYTTQFSLILKSSFSQKYSNQFLREESNSSNKLHLLPVFILSFTLFLSYQNPTMGYYANLIFWVGLFFIAKYFCLIFLGYIFEKNYLFEEVIFQSFLYEKVVGVVLFPFTLILFYGPFQQEFMFRFITIFLLLALLYKWLRMLFLSFFNSSLPKSHIIIYLCTFEILPIIIIVKHLY
tara:strand:+ start:9218 stop:9847 length:630 start_codon:yes stop_codon:yes gene_type:complete